MRRQLNTVYVATEGAWLRKDGENLVMEVEQQERARLPMHLLDGIVCIGRVMASPQLLGFCCERGITVSYLSPNGRFLARVEGPVSGNVLLRKEQYRRSDSAQASAIIARNMLTGKIHNQRMLLARGARDHEDAAAGDDSLRAIAHQLRRHLSRIGELEDLDVIRGIEGDAARAYFSVFDQLVRAEDPCLRFNGRTRRPPADPINALLSFLYTLLTHDFRSAIESVGLDPSVGLLHRDRPGRPSLALDLSEELRPVLADRLALTLINRRQVGLKSFRRFDNGSVLLTDDGRRVVLAAFQERKREPLTHPFLDEKIPLGMVPFAQAQLLSRYLRGDLDGYPPFLWK